MGKILYGDASMEIAFDDRVLTHLQIVIGAKLRRHESFFFSWKDDVAAAAAAGEGRSSIWLDSSIPLYFRYFGGRVPDINREWIALLMDSSNSSGGLQLVKEPTPANGTHGSHGRNGG